MIVTLDGPDGVGKSTISKRIAEDLEFAYIHYPFYENETGEKITDMLSGKLPWDPLIFQCLQTCNRIQIMPHLKKLEKEYGGVILDRCDPSTWVYGQLDGLSKELINQLISVLPKADLEIIIIADKPYRKMGSDFYEQDSKWYKTKELYLEYVHERMTLKDSPRWYQLVTNNAEIEICIEQCLSLINEYRVSGKIINYMW